MSIKKFSLYKLPFLSALTVYLTIFIADLLLFMITIILEDHELHRSGWYFFIYPIFIFGWKKAGFQCAILIILLYRFKIFYFTWKNYCLLTAFLLFFNIFFYIFYLDAYEWLFGEFFPSSAFLGISYYLRIILLKLSEIALFIGAATLLIQQFFVKSTTQDIKIKHINTHQRYWLSINAFISYFFYSTLVQPLLFIWQKTTNTPLFQASLDSIEAYHHQILTHLSFYLSILILMMPFIVFVIKSHIHSRFNQSLMVSHNLLFAFYYTIIFLLINTLMNVVMTIYQFNIHYQLPYLIQNIGVALIGTTAILIYIHKTGKSSKS